MSPLLMIELARSIDADRQREERDQDVARAATGERNAR
jgi:hypothetical protein